MIVEEIFTQLATHMIEGIMIHDQIKQEYDFLGLYGFAKCHEYHYLEESKGYECLIHYYATHYHRLLNIPTVSKPTIIPETWYKYNTMAVDGNTKRQATQTLMKKWVEWEQETKKLYQNMYQELCNLGEVAAATKIKWYICEVDDELKHAEKKMIKLETIEYNINTIIGWQQPMYKKFKKRMR